MSRDTLLANGKIHGLDPEIYLTEVIKSLPHNATAAQTAELTLARFAAALRTDCPSHSQHATQALNLTRPKSPRAMARLNAPKIQPQKKLKITLDSI